METLEWLKNFLENDTAVAVLALSLIANAILYRQNNKTKDQHLETVREIVPLLAEVSSLAGGLSDVVEWLKSMQNCLDRKARRKDPGGD